MAVLVHKKQNLGQANSYVIKSVLLLTNYLTVPSINQILHVATLVVVIESRGCDLKIL